MKGGNTIRSLLVVPKDKDNITKKSGVIYRYKCNRLEFDVEYIEESARTFGERLKEHLRAPSLIYDYANTSYYHTQWNNFSIVGKESHTLCQDHQGGYVHKGQ